MDEFIEFIFIINDILDAIENNKDLEKFADEINVSYEGIMHVIELRDEIICDMATMGLNPYYNGLNIARGKYNLVDLLNRDLSMGMVEICKIKKCLYEGYRMNLCTYNINIRSYQLANTGVKVLMDSMITKGVKIDGNLIKPSIILVCDITLKENINSYAYAFSGNIVSVLDGFIDDIDQEFSKY